jgi:hypothetical protein
MNYAYHTMDIIQCLITNPNFYPSQKYVSDKTYSAYDNMFKRIYRILAHASYDHQDVYLKYENEYSLCNHFVTFWLQFRFMKTKELYHKK